MTPDEARARRWALARQHHPDLGGDPAEFDRAMRSLAPPSGPTSTSTTRGTTPGTSHDIVFTPSARTRLRRSVAATRASVGTHVLRLARLTRRAP